jgi:hypothetical protein
MSEVTQSKANLPLPEEPSELHLANPTEWQTRTLAGGRFLVSKPQPDARFIEHNPDIWIGSSSALFDMFFNFIERRWSGEVVVDTGTGVKRIFFISGQIVFAGSNVIDDRLGEVIYRAGLISLEEHTASTVKVGKRKFGQVLLDNGIFSSIQLWQAFKLQVEEIVRSVFLPEKVYVEFSGDYGKKAENEMLFERNVPAMVSIESKELVVDSYCYGLMCRDFNARWQPQGKINLNDPDVLKQTYSEEKFYGYLVRLIEQAVDCEDVIQKSKMTRVHSMLALMDLNLRGICSIELTRAPRDWAEWVVPLKAKLDVYAMLLTSIKRMFEEEGKTFPVDDLVRYGQLLNTRTSELLFFNPAGEIRRESAQAMFLLSTTYMPRVNYFQERVERLTQFLLQISSDAMSGPSYARIRQTFKSIIS